MPRFTVRRPVAIALSTAMVATSVAVLLVSSAAPQAGAAAAPGSTLRASVKDPGQLGEGNEQSPNGGHDSVLSADGNHVAFVSNSRLDNLDVGWGESRAYDNVFVRDLARNRTVMISRGRIQRPVIGMRSSNLLRLNGAKAQQLPEVDVAPDDDSFSPSISADGRYVAFLTQATNLFEEDPYNDTEVVVADRDPNNNGTYDENIPGTNIRDYDYYRIQQSEQDIGSYEYARDLKMADNASRLVWAEGEGSSYLRTVPLKLPTGQVGLPVGVPSGPDNTNENVRGQFDAAISGDGEYIVAHVIVQIPREACVCRFHAIVSTEVATNETTRVDHDESLEVISTDSDEFVMHPAISNDGRVIAFVAEQFTEDEFEDFSSTFDEPTVFVVEVDYGNDPDERVTRSTLASRNNAGAAINGWVPDLSADGRYLAFVTDAVDAHDGEDGPTNTDPSVSCLKPPPPATPRMGGAPLLDLNAAVMPPRRDAARTDCQVVVRDLVVDRERVVAKQARLAGTLASPNVRDGNAGNADTVPDRDSAAPSLSADGRRVGYDSDAANLVDNDDTNRAADVFVRTFQPTLRGSNVDFGPVELGQALVRTAAFDQVGAGPLFVEAVTLTGPNAADFAILGQDCLSTTVPVGQGGNCRVTVEFTPATVGDKRAQLVVRVRGGRTFISDLLGSGTEQPVPPRGAEFSASPAPLEFGSRLLLSNGPESTVTITNQGESPLVVSNVAPVGPGAPEDYAVSANTCAGASVPAGGTCQVSVKFSPTLPGDRVAALQFTDNAAGSPHLVGLRGQSGQPTVEVSPGVTPPSRVVMVSGKGFPPGKNLTLTFTTAQERSTATVAADGTFRGSILVFAKAKAENRTLVATVDGSPALFGTGQLLVVFPSVSPADFVVRG